MPILGPLLIDDLQAEPETPKPAPRRIGPTPTFTSMGGGCYVSCCDYDDFGAQRTPKLDDHRILDLWNRGEWPPQDPS